MNSDHVFFSFHINFSIWLHTKRIAFENEQIIEKKVGVVLNLCSWTQKRDQT